MKKAHWTERSVKDYRFRIVADFIAQLEKKIESLPIKQNELAKRLKVTKGRVSQIFNKPGNITLDNIVKYARTLGMKVSLVAYEDDDPENQKGPINPEVFQICWEQSGKPRDFWDFQEISEATVATAYAVSSVMPSMLPTNFLYMEDFLIGTTGQVLAAYPKYHITQTAFLVSGDIQKQDKLEIMQ